jgi:hypothetical protein
VDADRSSPGRAGTPFWLLTGSGWLFGFVSLLKPNAQPFSAFAIVAGALLIASGVLVLLDGARAMGPLGTRYALWLRGSGTRSTAVGIIVIGACWLFAGVYLTVA